MQFLLLPLWSCSPSLAWYLDLRNSLNAFSCGVSLSEYIRSVLTPFLMDNLPASFSCSRVSTFELHAFCSISFRRYFLPYFIAFGRYLLCSVSFSGYTFLLLLHSLNFECRLLYNLSCFHTYVVELNQVTAISFTLFLCVNAFWMNLRCILKLGLRSLSEQEHALAMNAIYYSLSRCLVTFSLFCSMAWIWTPFLVLLHLLQSLNIGLPILVLDSSVSMHCD